MGPVDPFPPRATTTQRPRVGTAPRVTGTESTVVRGPIPGPRRITVTARVTPFVREDDALAGRLDAGIGGAEDRRESRSSCTYQRALSRVSASTDSSATLSSMEAKKVSTPSRIQGRVSAIGPDLLGIRPRGVAEDAGARPARGRPCRAAKPSRSMRWRNASPCVVSRAATRLSARLGSGSGVTSAQALNSARHCARRC